MPTDDLANSHTGNIEGVTVPDSLGRLCRNESHCSFVKKRVDHVDLERKCALIDIRFDVQASVKSRIDSLRVELVTIDLDMLERC